MITAVLAQKRGFSGAAEPQGTLADYLKKCLKLLSGKLSLHSIFQIFSNIGRQYQIFLFCHENIWARLAIKATTTVRECGPHAHCADRTPHSNPKKVRTPTVIRTSNVLFK